MRKITTTFLFLLGTITAYAGPIDLALGRVATQSSVSFGGTPDLAVDGNTDGNFFNGSVTHTGFDTNSWWKVDLGNTYSLNDIFIWNRTDNNEAALRLSNFTVSILDSFGDVAWSTTVGSSPSPSVELMPSNVSGQFVQVQLLNQTQWLSLAEVQVYGTAPDSIAPEPGTVVLLGSGMAMAFFAKARRSWKV